MTVTPDHTVCAYPWQQMNIDLTGEVVPCCFWSGYGNKGKPLGNTNENTIEEIWNGPAYKALRRANAEGLKEGHPCHECIAWRWSGDNYPGFTWPASFRKETGVCWTTPIPDKFLKELEGAGEPVLLHEDGVPMPHPDAMHDEIRNEGGGRYSVWGDTLYLSTTDGSDPTTNGRSYELVCGEARRVLASGLRTDSQSGENMLTAHEEYLEGKAEMEAKPTLLSFIATSDCNIDCPSCSQNLVRLVKVQHRGQTELDVLKLVPYLFQLIWHGGEPYLIKHFRQFIDGFETEHNPNLTFGFTSNGTLLNEDELAKLKKFPRINASVSIDSFVEDTFHVIREGANYGNVVRNTLRAIEEYDAPDVVFSVGMIINKVNLLELPHNLAFAMEKGVGLNLSPVVVTPVYDRLDIFNDFEAQTRGWHEALDAADAVLEQARADSRIALRRVDPTGMVKALRDILDGAARRYAEVLPMTIDILDPTGSISNMRRPGILVCRDGEHSQPLTYVETPTAGRYTMNLPRGDLSGDAAVRWFFVHHLDEFMGVVDCDAFRDETGTPVHESGWRVMPKSLVLELPAFEPVPRERRNIKAANFGLPTADGLHVITAETINTAYQDMFKAELIAGHGLSPSTAGVTDPWTAIGNRSGKLSGTRHTEFEVLDA
jgi:radical SAM protein with 4Fe4S-binding SPASM domain